MLRSGFDVVGPQRDIQLAAGLEPIAELKQNDAGVGAGNPQFQPALLVAEGLVGEHPETEYVGVKRERAVLVRYRDADEFDASNHSCRLGSPHNCAAFTSRLQLAMVIRTIVICTTYRLTTT